MFEVTTNKINLIVNGEIRGFILYDDLEHYIVGSHVYVNPEERGKGYAGQLVDYFVKFAKERNKKIMATCPVIRRNLEMNYPEMLKS